MSVDKDDVKRAFLVELKQESEQLLSSLQSQQIDINAIRTKIGKGEELYSPIPASQVSLLHLAAHFGWVDAAIDLITKHKCDPASKDSRGSTPLHYSQGYYRYSPHGRAVSDHHLGVTLYLLSTGKVDPFHCNDDGNTALTESLLEDNFIPNDAKVVLTGYSGAGKTKIIQLILHLVSKIKPVHGHFENVTAGIIPYRVNSKVKKVKNMVIYDFAGQQDYYSSHAVQVIKSADIFICLVDLSQSKEKISESVHYWTNFLESTCSSAVQRSLHIFVGSHADLVKSSQEQIEKCSLIESIIELKKLTYAFVSMDCQRPKSKAARKFLSLLLAAQENIESHSRIPVGCFILYDYLRKNLKTGCSLQELCNAFGSKKDSFSTLLKELLAPVIDHTTRFSLVQNQEQPEYSWVSMEMESILSEVNKALILSHNNRPSIIPITTLEKLLPHYSKDMLVCCLESMAFCHSVEFLSSTLGNAVASSSETKHLFFPGFLNKHQPDSLPTPRFGWSLECSQYSSKILYNLLLRIAFLFPLASMSKHVKHAPEFLFHFLEQHQCQVWQNGISWKCVSGESTVVVEVIDHNHRVVVLVSKRSREAAEICNSVIKMIFNYHQLCGVLTVKECLISPTLLDCYPFDALPDTDLTDLFTIASSMPFQKEGQNGLQTDEALCEQEQCHQNKIREHVIKQSILNDNSPEQLHAASATDLEISAASAADVEQPTASDTDLKQSTANPTSDQAEQLSCTAANIEQQTAVTTCFGLLCSCCWLCRICTEQPTTEQPMTAEQSHTHPTTVQPDIILTAVRPFRSASTATQPSTAEQLTAVGGIGDIKGKLTLKDLNELDYFLAEINDWKTLGLRLGLYQPTLNRIDHEQRGKISDCMKEVLTAWLKWKDNVKEMGVPSWELLKEALIKMEEKEMAHRITTKFAEQLN